MTGLMRALGDFCAAFSTPNQAVEPAAEVFRLRIGVFQGRSAGAMVNKAQPVDWL
jgi:hypothetical protein